MKSHSEPDNRSDEELIDTVNSGDQAAFESLYYRYRNWVVGLAYRFTGNRDDALDTLQETFIYLLKKFPGFYLTSRMTTFLYPAVKHIAIRIKTKKRQQLSFESVLYEAAGKEPDDEKWFADDLAALVTSLPEAQKEVLLMRFVDQMSLKEIGKALGSPVGTVKSRLHHALAALRENPRTSDYFCSH